MSSCTHFTLEERNCLQELLARGYSMRKAAVHPGRNVSSVSREIRRNQSKKPKKTSDNEHNYHAWRARTLTIVRQKEKVHRYCPRPGSEQWEYIVEKLRLFRSPEEIVCRWRKERPVMRICGVSTICRYIKAGKFEGITQKTHLRRGRKKSRARGSVRGVIQPERLITQWPEEIRSRSRVGDREGDTVSGAVGKGLLLTQVDRKSRFLRAALLPGRDAALTKKALVELLRGDPVHSLSFDNGSEFAQFKEMEEELHTLVYFAEPCKPWQRGTNGNTNDLLRFFFPKGFDFLSISQEDVDFVVELINNRPRKCLDWMTPAEIFYRESVALT